MEDSTKTRFSDAPWFQLAQNMDISIVGAGGTGSFTAFYLSRLGYKSLLIFDDDIVEKVNLAGQLYKVGDINQFKVRALNKFIKEYSPGTPAPDTSPYRFVDHELSPVVFSCVDNMKTRQQMFKCWLYDTDKFKNAIFIDQRLNLEQMQIFCIRRDDKKSIELFQEKYLFDDSEVQDPVCTLKQTTFAAATIAGLAVGFYTNHLANLANNNNARSVPFFTEYFSPLNLMSNEPV